jgi:hypothetical protein
MIAAADRRVPTIHRLHHAMTHANGGSHAAWAQQRAAGPGVYRSPGECVSGSRRSVLFDFQWLAR